MWYWCQHGELENEDCKKLYTIKSELNKRRLKKRIDLKRPNLMRKFQKEQSLRVIFWKTSAMSQDNVRKDNKDYRWIDYLGSWRYLCVVKTDLIIQVEFKIRYRSHLSPTLTNNYCNTHAQTFVLTILNQMSLK